MPAKYKYVKRKHHPLATPSGRIPEHRVVLYEKIGPGAHPCRWCGKLLTWAPGERTAPGVITVDHVDEDTLNNDPSNLVPSCHECNVERARDKRFVDAPFIVNADGVRELAEKRVCQRASCGKTFLIAKKHLRRTSRSQGRYCSRECMYARNR